MKGKRGIKTQGKAFNAKTSKLHPSKKDSKMDILTEEEEEEASGADSEKVISKRKLGENETGVPEKKRKVKSTDSSLYKPPTVKELNQLRETENLFHSNLFRLQVQEMLKEVQIRYKYRTLFHQWIEDFKKVLEKICDDQESDVMDCKLLKKLKVKMPLSKLPHAAEVMKLKKPTSVSVFGSFGTGCCLGPDFRVDVKVEIPQDCFDAEDYLNLKYHRKQAIYMAYVAGNLQNCDIVEQVHFSQSCGNPLKTVLEVKPKGKLNKHVLVVIHFPASASTFRLARFSPEKNNARPNWYFGEKEVQDKLPPTPHYSCSILMDLVIDRNEEFCTNSLETCSNLKDGILLLKVWLKQRGLDQGYGCFSGYIMTMFVLYLVQSHRINSSMSSYQIARSVWSNLAQSNWITNGIALAHSGQQEERLSSPTISEFHRYFDVVFVDVTGYCNLCANMSKETFLWVKSECELAVKCLDNPNINSFQATFMTSLPFYQQFDHIISIQDSDTIEKIVEKHSPKAQKLDYIGHMYPQALNLILNIVRRGLEHRVCHVGIMMPNVRRWSIKKLPPSSAETVTLGLILNPEFAFSVLEKGPGANLPEALQFREFWGKKSEVRRFQDGSISEAVVWNSGSATLAQRRIICKQIITYLLNEKFGFPAENGLVYIADQLDLLLEQHKFKPAGFDYGTGEEATVRIIGAFDNLGKQLRELEDIPLEVTAVLGTSSVFRYSDVFPPLGILHRVPKQIVTKGKSYLLQIDNASSSAPRWVPLIEGVVQLGLSGKWPNNLYAVQRIKAALYIKIADCLSKQFGLTTQPYSDCLHILKDGFVFRLQVAHQHEVALLKETVTPEGVTRYRDTDESLALEKNIVHLPKLTSALHGLHQQYGSYGPTCCLAKRWLSAQLLDPFHIPEMCIELLVASLYLMPEPYRPPSQPQLGFFRFLHLMAHTNWNTEPIILNLNGEMNREDILEIETWFHTCRSVLPPLFLSTPYDKKNSLWSKEAPSLQILIRIAGLAEEALSVLQNLLLSSVKWDWKQIFRPPLHVYDILIHLIPHRNPRRFEAIDGKFEKPKYQLSGYSHESGEKIPVTQFSPVYCFLDELRENYSDYALFFCDIYGGDIIGVVWKPTALSPKDFKVSNISCHKLSKDGCKIKLNIDAIIDDICSLGKGIVSSIEVKSHRNGE